MDPKVWTFFYGSFINVDVLREVDFVPEAVLLARLSGYDIRIEPLANLVPDEAGTVYGILVPATHAELQRLYGQGWVGTYLPHAVLATRPDGAFVPALCYVAPSPPRAPARADYVDRIVRPARAYGFPAWYIARLESFRPGT
ncbi:MAG TPA: gamma-glutamylcyclotransferase family protein [Haliangiales bacterium]|nr:gamma-glutamylcyclotransferase family protein [Haliangiales bacterium]